MTRATLGRSRLSFRFTIEQLRTLLLIGGGLLVVVIAVFLAAGQWKLRKSLKDLPGRLGMNIEQSSEGINYTQTRKGKTIFKLHAAKAITRKTGGTTVLHDVKIDLYGDDGNRADTITGSEFEYDPNAGIATAAGAVEILMMRPGVKPAISTLKPGAPKPTSASAKPGPIQSKQLAASPVLGAITDDQIHIKTSGLTFNQKTGVATTEQRVDFALRQGSGNSIGATYDSPNGHLILDHAVELMVERNGSGKSSGPVTVHASHAEFVHDAMECQMTQAHATYTGGSVETSHALMHFRDDGSVSQVDGSDGVDLRTAAGSHVTAPTGSMAFDAANHPQRGLLTGGTRLEMNEPNRQVQGTAPTAQLTFDAQGELSLAHMEQGVVFNSQQQVTTAKGEEAQIRRTWNSRTADVAFAPAAATVVKPAAAGKQPEGHVEPHTIHGFGGVVVTSQTVTGGVAMPSRLAADTLVAELASGGAISAMHGEGHASFDERNAAGVHQATSSDVLDVHFVPVAKTAGSAGKTAATAGKSKEGAGGSEISSLVEIGHVVLIQDPPPASQTAHPPAASAQKAGSSVAPSGIRATSNRADYDGATEILHLTGSPRVHDGAMDMTANVVDFARASGDAFAHGDVRASWTGSGAAGSSSSAVPGTSLLAGNTAGSGGNGPIHAIAAEAELHQASQEVVFRGAGAPGMPRLWQSVNAVSAPTITLNRTKQTLVAVANGAAEPVRTVLVSQGGMSAAKPEKSDTVAKPKAATPSVIRIRSGELHYSEAERIALFHSGQIGQVTAETTDTGGSSTIVSRETDVTLLPAGTHAASQASNASIDVLTATGHVAIDWPGRHATGEKLVYRDRKSVG